MSESTIAEGDGRSSLKNTPASPLDSPREAALEGNCGLSATTSECSSQPNSRSNRREAADGAISPSGDCGAISSWMPIVDEEDRNALALPITHGDTAEETSPVPQCVSNDEFRKSIYESQARRWQQEESTYMKHEGWCEYRIVLLLQEAFRCSYKNLKQARHNGAMSADVYAARAEELKNSLLQIKKEYRRTLQRTRERNGDLSSIASKAVTCIASVYPWSSSGFVMGFEENIKFGELTDTPGSCGRRNTPLEPRSRRGSVSTATPPPRCPTLAAPKTAQQYEHVEAVAPPSIEPELLANGRRLATPRVSLRPLPPRRQIFRTGLAPDGSPLLSPAHVGAPAEVVSFASAPLQVDTPNRGFCAVSPNCASTGSPVQVPAVTIAGPVRSDERRFLEKRQLVLQGMAFASRSLASSIFIAGRRAAIASATMRQRLALTRSAEIGLAPPPCGTTVANADPLPPPLPPPAPVPLMTSLSFPDVCQLAREPAGMMAGTGSVVRRNRLHFMPCPPPYATSDGGAVHINPTPRAAVLVAPTLVAPAPPAYAQAVAVSGDYSLVCPVRLPPCYPSQIRRDRIRVDQRSPYPYFPTMPPVSLEEERHVRELW
ncbi:hypothetical protein NESM_000692800 [Novymonas esmeraldas]|uniref:Uncharacterized protein n=1 Tax=Novymonas esmeraldas TaxID=1808958 RepID=A0AAW0EWH3_9TRYP